MPKYDEQRFDPPAPVATVALRTLDRRKNISDVLMLVDSGASVTLIPASSVIELGFGPAEQRPYELVAFDGTHSFTTAVQCEVVFLGKVYRSEFPILDSEYGILGRDILNHVSLLLDGPDLNWRETPPPVIPKHEK